MSPNRFDQDSMRWWDDLPPRIRARFTPAFPIPQEEPVPPPPPRIDPRLLRVSHRFTLLVLLMVVLNVAVLVTAIWLLSQPAPFDNLPKL